MKIPDRFSETNVRRYVAHQMAGSPKEAIEARIAWYIKTNAALHQRALARMACTNESYEAARLGVLRAVGKQPKRN